MPRCSRYLLAVLYLGFHGILTDITLPYHCQQNHLMTSYACRRANACCPGVADVNVNMNTFLQKFSLDVSDVQNMKFLK